MTTTPLARNPLTARDVLFADPDEAPRALQQAIEDGNLLESLPNHLPAVTTVAARYVLTQVVEAIDGLLGALHLNDLLLGGWLRLDEIQSAMEATTKDQGTRHVSLASHSISSEHSPSIELMLHEVPVRLLDLQVALGFTIDACELVVRDGKVDGVELGSVSAEGALAAATKTLIRHATDRLDVSRIFAKPDPVDS